MDPNFSITETIIKNIKYRFQNKPPRYYLIGQGYSVTKQINKDTVQPTPLKLHPSSYLRMHVSREESNVDLIPNAVLSRGDCFSPPPVTTIYPWPAVTTATASGIPVVISNLLAITCRHVGLPKEAEGRPDGQLHAGYLGHQEQQAHAEVTNLLIAQLHGRITFLFP